MEPEVPSKPQLQAQAQEGRPITQAEASSIAAAESALTEGRGPIKGGAASTAQSLHDRQQNFLERAGEVARKPAAEITKEDAAQVQGAEVCTCMHACDSNPTRTFVLLFCEMAQADRFG